MATLTELVQGLPQEFFDRIVNYTFATPDLDGQSPTTFDDIKVQVVIDKNYKPPFHLQINRATRIAFAEKYYNKVCFVTPHPNSEKTLANWTNSLTDTHGDAIRFVKFDPAIHPDRRKPIEVVVKITRTDSRYSASNLYGMTGALRNGRTGWFPSDPSMIGTHIYLPDHRAKVSRYIGEQHGSD